jgi:hypothetical protein
VKVTIEYKKSPDPEARLDRLMDIILRDLERLALTISWLFCPSWFAAL